MRIEVSRSGGFAGITRRGAVDTAHRSDAADWHRLVGSATRPSGTRRHGPAPDRFVYRIVIDRQAGQPTGRQEMTVGEGELTGPLRELVNRVLSEGAPG